MLPVLCSYHLSHDELKIIAAVMYRMQYAKEITGIYLKELKYIQVVAEICVIGLTSRCFFLYKIQTICDSVINFRYRSC